MGEGMSKRLKVQLGSEAEMEERAFNNPYPDYQPHGSTASASTTLPTPNDSEDNRCSSASPQGDDSLPFESDSQISSYFNKKITTKIKDLLQQMEEGLKTADPHDCSAYTGWTESMPNELQNLKGPWFFPMLECSVQFLSRTGQSEYKKCNRTKFWCR